MAQSQQVVSTDYPFLRVRVGIRGRRAEALALIDTGFEGAAVAPEDWADETLSDPEGFAPLQMADGSVSYAPLYVGSVEVMGLAPIDDIPITILGNEYMLGRDVIDLYAVTFDHGKRVVVEP